MSYLDDPRVFLATERTLLAWIRTEIAILALAFLIRKFGLGAGFESELWLAVAALCGATVVLSIFAAIQAWLTLSKLGEAEVPGPLAMKLVVGAGVISVILNIGMSAVVLAI